MTANEQHPVLVGSESDLRAAGTTVTTISGREIAIFAHRNNFYALDRQCYHAGGPLQMGDIEDIQGKPCIVCPWHRYIISMDTGEGFYKSIDPSNMKKPPEWKSKGVKQRTHHVTVNNGKVYVQISDLSENVPSDHYYSEEYTKLVWNVPENKKK